MREQVFAAVIRRDEAVALRVVKPLHGACCHTVTLSLIVDLSYRAFSTRAMPEPRPAAPNGKQTACIQTQAPFYAPLRVPSRPVPDAVAHAQVDRKSVV